VAVAIVNVGNHRQRWAACALVLAATFTGNAGVQAQVLPEVPQEYWKYQLTEGCKSFEKPLPGFQRAASLPAEVCVLSPITYDNTVSFTVLVFSYSKSLEKLKMWVDVPSELRVIQSDIPQFFKPTPGTFHRFQLVIQGEAPNLTGFSIYAEDKSSNIGNAILRSGATISVLTQNGYLRVIPAVQAAKIRDRNRRDSLPKTGEHLK
jgi:hypothetical protein